jgi:GNAT superfamily N-acetyltransferase
MCSLDSIPFLPTFLSFHSLPFLTMTSSPKMVLRTLEDLDYSNTRALMSERFSRGDVQAFVEMWHWRNFEASLCIEFMGAILGFALVLDNKLEYLVVSDRCEGQGFGRILLKYVISQLREQDYRSVTLMTANDPTLRRWYGRQGFEHSSTSWDEDGVFGDTMVYRFRVKRAAAKRHPHASTA